MQVKGVRGRPRSAVKAKPGRPRAGLSLQEGQAPHLSDESLSDEPSESESESGVLWALSPDLGEGSEECAERGYGLLVNPSSSGYVARFVTGSVSRENNAD